MSKIVLDVEAFRALSSDTRLQILKALDARRLTVSELGRLLNLNKATVYEHLKQLSVADLVKKEDDEGRKWVYYKLTWKGKNVVHPENIQFTLLLATGALSVGGLVAQLGNVLNWWWPSTELGSSSPSGPSPSTTVQGMNTAPEDDPQSAGSPSQPTPQPAPNHESDQGTNAPPQEQASVPDQPLYENMDFWLLVALGILLLVIGLLAFLYLRERRRERYALEERLAKAGSLDVENA